MIDERRDRTGGENRKSEESNEELKSQRYKPGKAKKKKRCILSKRAVGKPSCLHGGKPWSRHKTQITCPRISGNFCPNANRGCLQIKSGLWLCWLGKLILSSTRNDQCQLRNYTEKLNFQRDSAHSQLKRTNGFWQIRLGLKNLQWREIDHSTYCYKTSRVCYMHWFSCYLSRMTLKHYCNYTFNSFLTFPFIN